MYFGLFWLGEAVNAVLGFKVIHEIFLDVFRPYHTLKDLGTLLFKWAGVVMLLVSVVVAFSNSFDRESAGACLTTLQRSVRIVQLGLILFLLLFSRFLGVSRKQISFGISLGFGLFAGVELMLMALQFGGFITPAISQPDQHGHVYTCHFCLARLLALAPSRARAAANHLQTQRWEQDLADLQHPVPSDSLIPMFEDMVERAFSRSSNLEAAEVISRSPSPASTQSQLRCGRFQEPAHSLACSEKAHCVKTLSRRFLGASANPSYSLNRNHFYSNHYLKKQA